MASSSRSVASISALSRMRVTARLPNAAIATTARWRGVPEEENRPTSDISPRCKQQTCCRQILASDQPQLPEDYSTQCIDRYRARANGERVSIMLSETLAEVRVPITLTPMFNLGSDTVLTYYVLIHRVHLSYVVPWEGLCFGVGGKSWQRI